MSSLLWLALLAAIVWHWLSSARAHEVAVGLCKRICRDYGVQLLDDTVSLRRQRPRRRSHAPPGASSPWRRWYWQRDYQFEFTSPTQERVQGSLLLHGLRPVFLNLPGVQENLFLVDDLGEIDL